MGCAQGMITMQHRKQLRASGSPRLLRLFKPNEQYCYSSTVIRTVSCGCGGGNAKNVVHYVVNVDHRIFEVSEEDAVVSTVEIKASEQDFELLRLTTIYQDKEHKDYSEINHNCTNCNGLVPHGDYNNNNDSPDPNKDPQLTGQI